jgi:hypothetical protein
MPAGKTLKPTIFPLSTVEVCSTGLVRAEDSEVIDRFILYPKERVGRLNVRQYSVGFLKTQVILS